MVRQAHEPVAIDEAWARDTRLIPGGFRMTFDPPVTPEIGRFRVDRMGGYLSWLLTKLRRDLDMEPSGDMEAQIDAIVWEQDRWTSVECSLHPFHNYT